MQVPDKQALDLNDGFQLRSYLESLRGWLSNERSTWDSHYADLARFMLPRSPRFNYTSVDTGQRRDGSLVDCSATFALRTLGAGMMSGVSSPSRTWFNLRTLDKELNDNQEVRNYLEECEEDLRQTFLRSNYYQTQHTQYRELGLYGTSAYIMLEDEKDGIRCHPYPVGSYYLSGNESLRVDLTMRIVSMTTRQMVDRFGFKNCSSAVQSLYVSNAGGVKEQWWPVVHVIAPKSYFGGDTQIMGKPMMDWVSIYYELSSFNERTGTLSISGFYENPVISPRWEVTGENFYGNSPAMDCLGDAMALQLLQKRKSQAIDKQVNPPMIASPSMLNQKMSILPGDITFADTREGAQGFKPAFQIQYDLQYCLEDIQQHQRRIQRALYEDLFLMLASSDRREVTAEEIRAKQEEKMLVLGPVLERLNDESLKPGIYRALRIRERAGKLPPMPKILRGQQIKVEFVSILAQAQRLLGIASIDRLMAFLGAQVAINPAVMDNIDLDKTARAYADMLGVPPSIMVSEDQLTAIRDQRNQMQQQQALAAQAETADKLASAGQTLSQTDMGGNTALSALIGQGPFGSPA